ncbi:MAG: YdcF family protein [Anaerolineae bacterium]|nr:YdcF family protein [Anaerolineae bacterium]
MSADPRTPDEIARYLAVEAPPQRADLAFVFGTRHPDPARIAAGLYRRGVVRYVILTGGYNAIDGRCESLSHLQILLDQGVPGEAVIVEQESANTLENVTCARRAIEAQIGTGAIAAVVAVAKWYHSRRALMTLRRHFPAGARYYAVTYEPPGFPRTGWERDPEVARRVRREVEAISRYLAAGHIAEIRLEGEAYI